MLTENTVRASDRRVRFVTVDAYEEAGGMRKLFQDDDGGWIEDVPRLERLVADKLKAETETIVEEGWKWAEVAADFPPMAIRMAAAARWHACRSDRRGAREPRGAA